MAEERLIDDDLDKDKKYRFRINEAGEEELVIETAPTPENEEEAILSPDEADDGEGYAYADEHEEERTAQTYFDLALSEVEKNNFSTALEYHAEAKKLRPDDGGTAALGLYIYTRGMTDYSRGALDGATEAAEDVRKYCTAEQKARLKSLGGEKLGGLISELSQKRDELSALNEQGKAERAEMFVADRARAAKFFWPMLAAFILTLAGGVAFAAVYIALNLRPMLIAAIIFGAVCAVFFVLMLVAARKFSVSSRRVKMNADDSRTQLGREYVAVNRRLEALRSIYNAISE